MGEGEEMTLVLPVQPFDLCQREPRSDQMVSRLQRRDEPLDLACSHLEEYLETKVRSQKSETGADKL
jgi:hypothetical protein